LFTKAFQSILNIQNNSSKYNEAHKASGGALGRYTTVSRLEDTVILTNDLVKPYLLDTKLAETYQVEGLDLSDRSISFDDLGGIWTTAADVTSAGEVTLNTFTSVGDYQIEMGGLIREGSVVTFDVSTLTEFVDPVEELKP